MAVPTTFSSRGVERVHAERAATIDLEHGWPTGHDLLGGGPGPLWDVQAPLDAPVSLTVIGPDGRLRLEVTTMRLLVGRDDRLDVVGAMRSFDDADAAADELIRLAGELGLPTNRVDPTVRRLREEPVDSRSRFSINGGEALGVRAGVTVHRLPARHQVPALTVLECAITRTDPVDDDGDAGRGEARPQDGAPDGSARAGSPWMRL